MWEQLQFKLACDGPLLKIHFLQFGIKHQYLTWFALRLPG